MKVVVAGSTGFLGTEVIRQALSHPKITTVVALARRETPVPEGSESQADVSKLKSVVCDDFINYPEHVKAEISDAHACIWYCFGLGDRSETPRAADDTGRLIAITPAKSKTYPRDKLREICRDYPLAALEAFSNFNKGKTEPFRFVYVSGSNAERDLDKVPRLMGSYSLMRGLVELSILERVEKCNGALNACVFKPGLINTANTSILVKGIQSVARVLIGLPSIQRDEVAAALLEKAVNGFEKDTYLNDELIEIGQEALKALATSQ
ncbi:hypothetical protein CEP54_002924 [Fusarium duplospermum]|uniref:NAD(P)-binding domain-containing protein n=1 Tax=Fusarium duplospermum TaxID=1325734 RepID=A0A428QS04_9HYPO|nr:hypothetical protein CEP54_002924 [Fusarium duplospermum]